MEVEVIKEVEVEVWRRMFKPLHVSALAPRRSRGAHFKSAMLILIITPNTLARAENPHISVCKSFINGRARHENFHLRRCLWRSSGRSK